MQQKITKKASLAALIFAGIVAAAIVIALILLQIRTNALFYDYSSLCKSEKYLAPVMVDGVKVVRQEISCGYAVIDMFSSWCGDHVTEKGLYETYGKVVTSTGKAFCAEMNKQFPAYTTTMHKYLKNSELLDLVYENLSAGIPVPFEWAALYGEDWTLHYSLIVGADIPGDKITVANPYGYSEEISIAEFLQRTSFAAYEEMPFFLKLGFAFGIFEKNTVFAVQQAA